MAQNPFSISPAELKKLEGKYKGRTTKPTNLDTFKVDARPRPRPQPKLEVVKKPSIGSAARSALGMVQNAPQGIADLAVSLPTAAYDYIRTSTPGDVAEDVKSGAGRFVDYVRDNPLEALAEMSPAGAAKDAGQMLREASLARDAGDEERAAQIEKFAVPMMLASIVPMGRAAKGAERVAAKAERASAPSLLSAIRANGKIYTGPTHLDALAGIPDLAARKAATLDANSRGFVNERGKFMNREKAADYARNFDLFSPNAPAWAKTAPEAISENLKLPEGYASAAPELAVRRVVPAAVAKPEPRIEPRKREAEKVAGMSVDLEPRPTSEAAPLSIFDMEGKPFITSMSDMSAAGDTITGINDVALNAPVRRMGGQDYMFDNPGSVWASDLGPAGRHLELARRLKAETGQDPLFMPWAMGPTAIDFAHMPRELMLQYAASNLGKRGQRELAADVRGIVPEFRAVDDPASIESFREAVGPQRGALNRMLDLYRDKGGLGIGAARLATTDLEQIGNPLTSLRNVGVIDANAALSPSPHPSYRTSLPGEGVGRLQEQVGALELLPDLMAAAELTDPFGFPVGVVPGVKSPLRALQMGPKGGVITEDMLRAIEDRLAVRKGNR